MAADLSETFLKKWLYIWFDHTRAVTPFDTAELTGLPDTYPFGV